MSAARAWKAVQGVIACERGNMLVELGFGAALLAIAVLGLFEYAAVTNQSIEISNAARAAVEYAVQDPSDTAGITDAAVKSGDLTAETLTVDVSQFCECPDAGAVACADTCADGSLNNSFVTVTLSQPAESILQSSGFMGGMTLEGSATLRTR